MKQHIGVKLINSKPMNRQEYNDFRGWDLPDNENGTDEGYLVEYVDGGEANTSEYSGYVSWSPKEVFERAYRQTDGMNFGLAIEMMKMGAKVARAGWNGKGMFCIYVPSTKNVAFKQGTPYANAVGHELNNEILPHIDMWTVNNDGRRAFLPGWLASQSDMLADDWTVVE